jgi:hypothetical protein
MYMGNFREKMMFYLEIQSSHQPAHEFIVRGKIRGCLYLVDGPTVCAN